MDSAGIYRRPLSLVSLLSQPSHTAARRPVSFLALLRRSAEQAAQRSRQRPFANRVAGVQGVVGPDRVERISSRRLADLLALEPKERTPAAWRAITAAMAEHGWTAVRFRAIGARGYSQQVRGFARYVKP